MTEGVTDLMYIASGTKDAQLDTIPREAAQRTEDMDPVLQGRHGTATRPSAAIERSPLNDIKEASSRQAAACWPKAW